MGPVGQGLEEVPPGRCHLHVPAAGRALSHSSSASLSVCPAQVKSVNLSEGELLSIRGVDGAALAVLANQTLLVEGQVIRSRTNAVSVYFRAFQDDGPGSFQLHYQGRPRGALGGLPPTGSPALSVPGPPEGGWQTLLKSCPHSVRQSAVPQRGRPWSHSCQVRRDPWRPPPGSGLAPGAPARDAGSACPLARAVGGRSVAGSADKLPPCPQP